MHLEWWRKSNFGLRSKTLLVVITPVCAQTYFVITDYRQGVSHSGLCSYRFLSFVVPVGLQTQYMHLRIDQGVIPDCAA